MTKKPAISEEIQELIDNEKFDDASKAYINLISDMKTNKMPLLTEAYYEYALFLFELNEYELSIMMFQSSYNSDYKKEEIIEFLYDAFILPNQDEFITSYKSTLLSFSDHIFYPNIPSYENLTIDFIPFDENKYFIFDNDSKSFEGIIDISNEGIQNASKITFNDEFSDIIITDTWNFNKIISCLSSAIDRKVYYIASMPIKALSFLKIPNIVNQIFSNLYIFESTNNLQHYFHSNTSCYLPQLYFTYSETDDFYKKVLNIIDEEHAYRLTPDGRDTSNVILTIGIPSFNRGHRALKSIQSLINLQYDSEIEFVVSNNCTNWFTVK